MRQAMTALDGAVEGKFTWLRSLSRYLPKIGAAPEPANRRVGTYGLQRKHMPAVRFMAGWRKAGAVFGEGARTFSPDCLP